MITSQGIWPTAEDVQEAEEPIIPVDHSLGFGWCWCQPRIVVSPTGDGGFGEIIVHKENMD